MDKEAAGAVACVRTGDGDAARVGKEAAGAAVAGETTKGLRKGDAARTAAVPAVSCTVVGRVRGGDAVRGAATDVVEGNVLAVGTPTARDGDAVRVATMAAGEIAEDATTGVERSGDVVRAPRLKAAGAAVAGVGVVRNRAVGDAWDGAVRVGDSDRFGGESGAGDACKRDVGAAGWRGNSGAADGDFALVAAGSELATRPTRAGGDAADGSGDAPPRGGGDAAEPVLPRAATLSSLARRSLRNCAFSEAKDLHLSARSFTAPGAPLFAAISLSFAAESAFTLRRSSSSFAIRAVILSIFFASATEAIRVQLRRG